MKGFFCMSTSSSSIEKKSLEAHVELCAERYITLQAKLDNLSSKVALLEGHVLFIRESLAKAPGQTNKIFITVGTALLGSLFAAIVALTIALAK